MASILKTGRTTTHSLAADNMRNFGAINGDVTFGGGADLFVLTRVGESTSFGLIAVIVRRSDRW